MHCSAAKIQDKYVNIRKHTFESLCKRQTVCEVCRRAAYNQQIPVSFRDVINQFLQ